MLIERVNEKHVEEVFGLTKHLLEPPAYFPTHIGNYMEWFSKENIRVFAACMKNICGAFVKKEFRGKDVADDLLFYVCSVYGREGTEYLGVDCETLNPTALRFWGKHFDNYTYSYHRRIDERVIGYDSYLEKEWGIR